MSKLRDTTPAHDTYIGRFAPSPTGPLHFGSLFVAVASYVDARAHHGQWLVRIEDLDPPREVAGSEDEILHALEVHGLHWDGEVVRQSERSGLYDEALAKLGELSLVYRCICTRRQLRGNVYPGTCRSREVPSRPSHSMRVKVANTRVAFTDLNFGAVRQELGDEVGDFIVRRRDGLHAYQLAVVVDDAAQNISHVVRGADLLDNTPRQIYLQQLLDLKTPAYLHLPVITNAQGVKLSKQSGAAGLDPRCSRDNLTEVLTTLGYAPPAELHGADPSELLEWATSRWLNTPLPTHLDPGRR